MPTRSGWLALGGGVGLIVVGRLFGLLELFLMGAAILVLPLAALGLVLVTRLQLEVSRELHPDRVHAGVESRVDLMVRNRGPRRTPVLQLHDEVSGTQGATLLLAPLEREGEVRAAYQLPTERRGLITIGPLDVLLNDPFGLAEVSVTAAGASELTVYPRIDDLAPLPLSTGNDPLAGAERPNSLSPSGDEFYALRPYVVGDDLRRVHWRSTARRDELMVRQNQLPWQGRAIVLLDLRVDRHTPASIELAVSATASIIRAGWARGDHIRLLTTNGTDSGFATGNLQIEAMMEHLATIQPSPATGLQPALDRLSLERGGALVIVTAARHHAVDPDAVGTLRGRFGRQLTVVFEPSSSDPTAPHEPDRGSRDVVQVTGRRPFRRAWSLAVADDVVAVR